MGPHSLSHPSTEVGLVNTWVSFSFSSWSIQGHWGGSSSEWSLPSVFVGGFLSGSVSKESTCPCRRCGFDPWVGKIPWRRAWQSTPVFLPGKFHGQRSLGNYSPWGHKELDMTELACTHMLSLWEPIFQVVSAWEPLIPRFHPWPLVIPPGHLSKPKHFSRDQLQSHRGAKGCQVGEDSDGSQVLFRKHVKCLMLLGLTALHFVHRAFSCSVFRAWYFSLVSAHWRRNPLLGDVRYSSEWFWTSVLCIFAVQWSSSGSTVLCVQNISIVKLLLTVSLNVQLPRRQPWLHSSHSQASEHYRGRAPHVEPRGLECLLWGPLPGQTQCILQRQSRSWRQTCFLSVTAEPQPRPRPEPQPPRTWPLPPSQPPVRFLTLSSPVLFARPPQFPLGSDK